MKKKMKYTTTIIKNGSSFYINIPKALTDIMMLEEGSKINFEITKNTIKDYQCKVCKLLFSSDDEEPECPACYVGKKHLEVIDE